MLTADFLRQVREVAPEAVPGPHEAEGIEFWRGVYAAKGLRLVGVEWPDGTRALMAEPYDENALQSAYFHAVQRVGAVH